MGRESRVYLDALLRQISAGPVVQLDHHQSVTKCLDGSVHANDPARALSGYVQVIRDGPGRHFQYVVRGAFIQEDLTQGRKKRSRRTPGGR